MFAEDAYLLRGFALALGAELLRDIELVLRAAPLRHMLTPGGKQMSAAMSNCGGLGWCSDARGYRYEACDPVSGKPWPAMPPSLQELSHSAAGAAGYADFRADACLINRYEPGARMTAHQDRDERDLTQPIVSVSLGLPMMFRFGGLQRGGKTLGIGLEHGDVLVWGGASRLCYHSVSPLKPGVHALLGSSRINLTFRVAG
ncbi:MAG: DNA oxidative demethylase AlkB [Planctomycetota bacterium]